MSANGGSIDRERFVAALLAWLDGRFGRSLGVRFAADTPLFENRLIDSIRVLELIAWTERATGRVIPDEMIRMDHFRTARTIAATFADPAVVHDVER
jgi:acyl carrier protein